MHKAQESQWIILELFQYQAPTVYGSFRLNTWNKMNLSHLFCVSRNNSILRKLVIGYHKRFYFQSYKHQFNFTIDKECWNKYHSSQSEFTELKHNAVRGKQSIRDCTWLIFSWQLSISKHIDDIIVMVAPLVPLQYSGTAIIYTVYNRQRHCYERTTAHIYNHAHVQTKMVLSLG